MAGSWRCSLCGKLAEHCNGHRWGGKEGVKAPVKQAEPAKVPQE